MSGVPKFRHITYRYVCGNISFALLNILSSVFKVILEA